MKRMAQPSDADFSHLPDVAWVRILTFLELGDRARAAATCRTLNDVFNHPSLWHTVEIHILGDLNSDTSTNALMPRKYLRLIQRFGSFFQDLSLIFVGYIHKLPEECRGIIDELSNKCRLQSLTLCVGTIITKSILYARKPRATDLEVIASLVSKAFRMQSFNLKSWPIYPGLRSINILENLVNNPRLTGLEKLSLYYQNPERATWASLNAILPSPEEILKTVEHFQYLRILQLRSTMLSEEIIQELSKSYHKPLERLAVFVTFSKHDDQGGIPWISEDAWLNLKGRCPNLKVEFSIMTRIPFIELAGLLKPEIPVTSIGYMRYSRCDSQDLQSITDKYSQTLEKIVILLSELEDVDDELLTMTTKCSKLTYLVFHGLIQYSTALNLAKIRGSNWQCYELMEENIITDQGIESYFAAQGEQQVVGQNESGEYYLIRSQKLQQEQTEEERDATLKDLAVKVSSHLEQRWFPLSKKVIDERLVSGHAGSLVVPEKFLQDMQSAIDESA